MPITYRIDAEQRLVYLEIGGILNVDEVRVHRQELRNDPAFSPLYGRLIDARAVSREVAPADLRRLAEMTRLEEQGSLPSRRAVVLRDVPTLNLMQVFQAYTRGSPVEYRVFGNVEDAERWLTGRDSRPGPGAPLDPQD